MSAWLANLGSRERMLVIGGGVLAAIIVIWGAIWAPLATRAAELDDSVASKRTMLASLQRARSLANADSGMNVDSAARQSLVLLVDQTHRNFGLEGALARNQPDGPNGIRVTLQNAPFEGLVEWLAGLESNFGVAVNTATIDGARAPGIVNATVVLQR